MESVPRFYVYILARPNGKVFYVGKGQGKRVFGHEREAKSACPCHKCRVIRKIWREGGEVQRSIVFTTDDEHAALAYEREQIALHGRKNLCNRTDGGEGPLNLTAAQRAKRSAYQKNRIRKPHSAETRRKIGDIQRGKKRGPLSAATRAKIAAVQKGRVSPFKGVPRAAEIVAKSANARRGTKQRPEVIETRRQRQLGRKMNCSPEERQRRADTIKRVGKPFQKGAPAHNKGVPRSEETKQKLSAASAQASGQQYDIISPNGVHHTTTHLKAFCQEHGLNYDSIFYYLKHNRPYKGWIITKRARDV
jgi:hypothetical protein